MKPAANPLFSTRDQLERLSRILRAYCLCPFGGSAVPGAVLENILAHVRGGRRMGTYDFIDVRNEDTRCGWQVKSTMALTTVTWKRVKIPSREKRIADSAESNEGAQILGRAIIDFCNKHAQESLEKYDLTQIGYARLIMHSNCEITYFEKLLCTRKKPLLFNPDEFDWRWSTPKVTTKKEQLESLHGVHRASGEKWFAWHGKGENQLHFSGERFWWPAKKSARRIQFHCPESKIGFDDFVTLLEGATRRS
jgi:hypothetical protein